MMCDVITYPCPRYIYFWCQTRITRTTQSTNKNCMCVLWEICAYMHMRPKCCRLYMYAHTCMARAHVYGHSTYMTIVSTNYVNTEYHHDMKRGVVFKLVQTPFNNLTTTACPESLQDYSAVVLFSIVSVLKKSTFYSRWTLVYIAI